MIAPAIINRSYVFRINIKSFFVGFLNYRKKRYEQPINLTVSISLDKPRAINSWLIVVKERSVSHRSTELSIVTFVVDRAEWFHIEDLRLVLFNRKALLYHLLILIEWKLNRFVSMCRYERV